MYPLLRHFCLGKTVSRHDPSSAPVAQVPSLFPQGVTLHGIISALGISWACGLAQRTHTYPETQGRVEGQESEWKSKLQWLRFVGLAHKIPSTFPLCQGKVLKHSQGIRYGWILEKVQISNNILLRLEALKVEADLLWVPLGTQEEDPRKYQQPQRGNIIFLSRNLT